MKFDHLGDLVTDGKDRIKRCHGFLKNHGDFVAANLSQLPLREGEQVGSVKADTPAFDTRWGTLEQTQNAHGGDTLAAAGFADQSGDPLGRKREAKAVDGVERTCFGIKYNGKVFNLQERRCHEACLYALLDKFKYRAPVG